MKNLNIEIKYTWEENGRECTAKAEIGGENGWQQWGAPQKELSEIMPLTEALNEAANDFIVNNCEPEEE